MIDNQIDSIDMAKFEAIARGGKPPRGMELRTVKTSDLKGAALYWVSHIALHEPLLKYDWRLVFAAKNSHEIVTPWSDTERDLKMVIEQVGEFIEVPEELFNDQ